MFFNKKPVTIITGYLGSGKTTVINELLKSKESQGLAIIVNDMGSVNIDASKIKDNLVNQYKMVELSNGCICCTLQEEFMTQIEALSKDKKVKRILVEASGISNPAAIAEGFLMYQEDTTASFYLDSITTVVDADRIYSEFLDDIENDSNEDADVINLVMDQIEFCNSVILNKCDLLPKEKIAQVKKSIRQLQKKANIIEATYGVIDVNLIFNGNKFDYDEVMNSSLLQQALNREKSLEDSGIEEYGIKSFVYENIKPFDHDLFDEFLEDYPEEIIRAKGYIWFSDDDIHVQLFEQAGRNASISIVSNWVASFDEKGKQEVFDNYPDILEDWDEKYGDRLNQIVFIGKDVDEAEIKNKLDACISI